MKLKRASASSSIRQIGQLPLPSSFLLKPLNSSNGNNQKDSQSTPPTTPPPNKTSRISLSDFLSRKLDKAATPPTKVQEKSKPFSSVVDQKDAVGDVDDHEHTGKKRRADTDSLVDEKVFQQFKNPRIEKEGSRAPSAECEIEKFKANQQQYSTTRNPFCVSSIGGEKRSTAPKHLVILGDDPKPRRKRRNAGFILDDRPKPLYNHYANGSGWWDCNMEGIDNEEVGCSDAWEGMGATTNLGGLDWH